MDNAPGASPRRYGAPFAMTLNYQEQASRYYRRNAGAMSPQRGQGWQKGGHPSERELSR